MGYYDDHSEDRYRERGKSKNRVFFASLIGAIIGALLVIFTIPTLSHKGILPYTIQPKENNSPTTNTNNGQNDNQKQVSYDVNTSTTKAVDRAEAAVVGVTNLQSTSIWSDTSGDTEEAAGSGSGVIYKKSGHYAYVVTNHHVVADASKLEVSFSDGTKAPAKLLGSDIWTDLAVLEIDGSNVQRTADFGNSDALKLGEPVMAIGNPLGPTFSGSVTQGIVSGLNRTIPMDIDEDGVMDWQAEVLQTDAAINPGNSGGALINIAGQVIGINSMKIATQSVEGIGLSIPINSAKPIINDLETYGKVKRPYMGVDLKSVEEIPAYYQQEVLKLPRGVNDGVALRQVIPNSPAAEAGLQELDVIVELDGEKTKDVIGLRKHLYQKKKVGDKMEVKFYREGKLRETTITLTTDIKK